MSKQVNVKVDAGESGGCRNICGALSVTMSATILTFRKAWSFWGNLRLLAMRLIISELTLCSVRATATGRINSAPPIFTGRDENGKRSMILHIMTTL